MNESRIWSPQRGPQTILIRCHVAQDILFGGARGGGKTDGVLGDWLYHLLRYGAHASGVFVRHTYPELYQAIKRARELFRDIGVWLDQKALFKFHAGGILRFRHLRTLKDAEAHQGESNTWVNIEEAGNYATPEVPDLLRATLRSVEGVVCRYLMTANPGGPGHNWLKSRYVDPSPPMTPFDAPLGVSGYEDETIKRIFIPARLKDNLILQKNDPHYWRNIVLSAGGQSWLLDAWLNGNWDVVAGGMFDDVWRREKHALKPFRIPSSWNIYRAFDWGSAKPFSVGWWAVSDGADAVMSDGSSRAFYPGTFFRIAELYGCRPGKPNVGLRTPDMEIASQIKQIEKVAGWAVRNGPADSSIFTEENGRSIADIYKPFNIRWKKADKSPGTRVAGWRRLHDMLRAALASPMEARGLFAFDTCTEFIRTLPTLPRSKTNPDDVDTNAEDHIGDETRYATNFRLNKIQKRAIGGL